MLIHQCEEFLSQCCGAEPHEYVAYFCNACAEASNFECPECGQFQEEKIKEDDGRHKIYQNESERQ